MEGKRIHCSTENNWKKQQSLILDDWLIMDNPYSCARSLSHIRLKNRFREYDLISAKYIDTH